MFKLSLGFHVVCVSRVSLVGMSLLPRPVSTQCMDTYITDSLCLNAFFPLLRVELLVTDVKFQ